MATQYGNECWCSREGVLDYERREEEGVVCDYPCAGDEVNAMKRCKRILCRCSSLPYRMSWAKSPRCRFALTVVALLMLTHCT